MGVDFIDYLIADPIVVPPVERPHYCERIVYLPHSYQPNDNLRPIASIATRRADFGLPDRGFVLCSFNNSYKICPRAFEIWMRVLQRVENSVLWLLRTNSWAEQNLRAAARTQGVSPERLIFADRLPHGEHLERHRHADLFVDSFTYNAHTTASDALWAGLPVVTRAGRQFAARVAASLLHALDLPELVTDTDAAYEQLILELAMNPDKLAAIRARLAENRLNRPLFDTAQYTRDIERAFQAMHERHQQGLAPEDIRILPIGRPLDAE
jgi:predicted O-linked N-acetylglucosamine transferase (SPINDLY family)